MTDDRVVRLLQLHPSLRVVGGNPNPEPFPPGMFLESIVALLAQGNERGERALKSFDLGEPKLSEAVAAMHYVCVGAREEERKRKGREGRETARLHAYQELCMRVATPFHFTTWVRRSLRQYPCLVASGDSDIYRLIWKEEWQVPLLRLHSGEAGTLRRAAEEFRGVLRPVSPYV